MALPLTGNDDYIYDNNDNYNVNDNYNYNNNYNDHDNGHHVNDIEAIEDHRSIDRCDFTLVAIGGHQIWSPPRHISLTPIPMADRSMTIDGWNCPSFWKSIGKWQNPCRKRSASRPPPPH